MDLMNYEYYSCAIDFSTWLFHVLPMELTILVFGNLDPKSLISSSMVSHAWMRFLRENEGVLWKHFVITEWPKIKGCIQFFTEGKLSKHYEVDYRNFYLKRMAWQLESDKLQIDTCETEWVKSPEDPLGLTVEIWEFSDGEACRTQSPWSPLTIFPSESGKDAVVFYYEVQLLDAGATRAMGIGIADDLTLNSTIPGWNRGGNTCGYHADNGLKYFRMAHGQPYADTYHERDVIGCGYDLKTRSVFFTKNGNFCGVAFSDVPFTKFYPMAGSMEKCKVQFNFGRKPFLFNLDHFYLTMGHIIDEQAAKYRTHIYRFKI